ncbi:hypothetical protein [Tumidithrix helvetica]
MAISFHAVMRSELLRKSQKKELKIQRCGGFVARCRQVLSLLQQA